MTGENGDDDGIGGDRGDRQGNSGNDGDGGGSDMVMVELLVEVGLVVG